VVAGQSKAQALARRQVGSHGVLKPNLLQ
jgi:hypothetical protein